MTQWQWIALAVYVVGFFLTLYVVGRLTRDQGAGDTEDGCGMLATMITWPIVATFLIVMWVLVGLPMWLLKKGQADD